MMDLIKKIIPWLLCGAFGFGTLACSEEMSDSAASMGENTDDGRPPIDDGADPDDSGFDPQPEPDPRFAIRHLLLVKIVYGPEIWGNSDFILKNEHGVEMALSPTAEGEIMGLIPALPQEKLELSLAPEARDQDDLYIVETVVDGEQAVASDAFVPCAGGCNLGFHAPDATETSSASEAAKAMPHIVLYIN